MEQAVCRLGNADRGECFHISQLWCLVIDNSKLGIYYAVERLLIMMETNRFASHLWNNGAR